MVIVCAVLHNICVKYNIAQEYDGVQSSDDDDADDNAHDSNASANSYTPISLRDKGAHLRDKISLHL